MLLKFIFVSAIFLIFSYIVFRIIVRNDYLKNQKLSSITYILELLMFIVHANLIYLFLPAKWPNFPSLPENWLLIFLFLLAFCGGLIILIFAWFMLGTATSFGQAKNSLTTKGIYRYSRNPQLGGYGILLLSFAILYYSWYSAGWFVIYLIISSLMIKSEEEFLSIKFGKEYENYCNIVPRIIKLNFLKLGQK